MSSESTGTPPEPAAATPRRGRAWVLVGAAGTLATAVGVVAFIMLINVALNGTGGSALPALAVMGLGVVLGGMLAALAFRHLGVRAGWRSAGLGALVGVIGVLLPWIVALVLTRVAG